SRRPVLDAECGDRPRVHRAQLPPAIPVGPGRPTPPAGPDPPGRVPQIAKPPKGIAPHEAASGVGECPGGERGRERSEPEMGVPLTLLSWKPRSWGPLPCGLQPWRPA